MDTAEYRHLVCLVNKRCADLSEALARLEERTVIHHPRRENSLALLALNSVLKEAVEPIAQTLQSFDA